jgi:hypothetical protein
MPMSRSMGKCRPRRGHRDPWPAGMTYMMRHTS